MRGNENQQFGFGFLFYLPLEQVSDHGQIAQARQFLHTFGQLILGSNLSATVNTIADKSKKGCPSSVRSELNLTAGSLRVGMR